jgi:hypothetical protein
MADEIQIPPDSEGLFAWFAANRASIVAAFRFVKKLRGITVRFVTPGSAPDRGASLLEGGDNIELPLPLKFSTTLGNPSSYAGGTASATYDQSEISALKAQVAELTTKHTALLAQLSLTGQNPQAAGVS